MHYVEKQSYQWFANKRVMLDKKGGYAQENGFAKRLTRLGFSTDYYER